MYSTQLFRVFTITLVTIRLTGVAGLLEDLGFGLVIGLLGI